MINSSCCAQKQTRYLLSWHFFWQNYSFSAVMYISVRTLPCRKLLNYSVEGLKTRLVKWLPINKTLQNQISLNILSTSCHTSRIQVWISVAFASPQNRTKKTGAGKDNWTYQQCHLTNKRLTGMCPCHGAQTENPSRWQPRSPTLPQPSPKLTNHPSYYSRFAAATFLHVEHETLMVADTGNTSSFL